jgi:hypothetical protein
MMIILEALLEHIPWKKGEHPVKAQAGEILDRWITTWSEQEAQTAISSNTLLTLMDGLAKEVCIKVRGKGEELRWQDHQEFAAPYPNYLDDSSPAGDGRLVKVYDDPEYLERFFLTEPHEEPSEEEDEFVENIQRFEVIITAADLFTLLNRYCARQHIRNPFDNPNSLGARISNDRSVMEKAGWEYVRKQKDRLQYKKVGGHYYWRFSKKVRAMG